MSYTPGEYVDLSYLNKKPVRSSTSSAGQFLVSVGTSFRFYVTEGGRLAAARRIPVALA